MCAPDVGDQDARRRRGDTGDVVVLGVPDPLVAQLLGLPCQRDAGRKLSLAVSPRRIGARSRIDMGIRVMASPHPSRF